MADVERNDDAAFADRMTARLSTTAVPPSLEARILADFDRIAEARRPGALMRSLVGWRDRIWPGAPVWQPAGLLALSLVIGLVAGAFVPPSTLAASTATTASDQMLSATDTTSPLDLYKDL